MVDICGKICLLCVTIGVVVFLISALIILIVHVIQEVDGVRNEIWKYLENKYRREYEDELNERTKEIIGRLYGDDPEKFKEEAKRYGVKVDW